MTEDYPAATAAQRTGCVVRLSDVPVVNLMPGANSHIIPGTNMTLSVVTLEANRYYPVHQHPHEQMIVVLKGELDAIVEGLRYRLREGEVLPIGGGIVHGACTLGEQCVVLDVFSPARTGLEDKLHEATQSAQQG